MLGVLLNIAVDKIILYLSIHSQPPYRWGKACCSPQNLPNLVIDLEFNSKGEKHQKIMQLPEDGTIVLAFLARFLPSWPHLFASENSYCSAKEPQENPWKLYS